MNHVPFFQHDLGAVELDSLARVLAGPILTTGETVASFEERLADYLGCAEVVAVTSCTAALHLSLLALDVGPGDEVVTTPMTFIATATSIIQAGATPVFVDVEPGTGNLDVEQVERALTPRTRAVMPVHLYGQMADMRSLRRLADRHGLVLIEDAAHCLEGERDGVRPAGLGETACFSFYATKSLTSGEGGAIATNDRELARKLRLLRLHGMTRTAADRARDGYQHWDMEILGWKYNMDNIQAALLLPQLDRLDDNWRSRRQLARDYSASIRHMNGVRLPAHVPGSRHAHHLFTVWVEAPARDGVLQRLQEQGVGVAVNYRAIHLLKYFARTFGHRPGAFPVAERIGDMTISLPFYPSLSAPAAATVVTALETATAAAVLT